MIKKFICWIWGHKVMLKAYSGKQIPATGVVGEQYLANTYTWRRSEYCVRCGKKVEE